MMRHLFCVFAIVSGAALAQSVASDALAASEQERARIRAERSLIESAFQEEERACYRRFAVNDCVGLARVTRRDGLADLRRQDLSINAQEAKRRGAEQISRTDEKVSAQTMREAEQRMLDAQANQQERINAMEARDATRLKAAQEAPQHTKERQERIDARDRAESERAAKSQAQAENRRVFESKQQETLKRRQENEKQRQARKRDISEPATKPGGNSSDKPPSGPLRAP